MKSLYLTLLPLLAVMIIVSCQKTENATQEVAPTEKATLGIAEADQPPLFEQCDAAASKEEQMECFQHGVMHYVMQNFKYPKRAYEEKLEGKIYASFLITTEGEVRDVSLKNFPKEWDNEAKGEAGADIIRLLTKMPKMAPALKDGKKVPVSFVLPINMKLN